MNSYDAVVVGAGAAGCWAAKELTEGGLRVALLDAGPLFPFDIDRYLASDETELRRRQPVQSRCESFDRGTAHLFVDDLDNPYTIRENGAFDWIRSRLVGGRTHLWGGVSLRMSDNELKAGSRDGAGIDWPLTYEELAPFYKRVESFLGVCGSNEGHAHVPDGCFLPSSPLNMGERRLKRALEERWSGRRLIPARIATRRHEVVLAAALATGRLTLVPEAVAHRVLTDRAAGHATGIGFIHKRSGRDDEVLGRVVVLCASTLESTRLLLLSAGPHHPDGIGNSSGTLGRYLMDHTMGVSLGGTVPLDGASEDVEGGRGAYIPAFRNAGEPCPAFLRSYGFELGIQASTPASRTKQLDAGGAFFWIGAFGEVLPRAQNRVVLDPAVRDAWGIPALSIEFHYGENESRMAKDQYEVLQEIVDAAGFVPQRACSEPKSPGLSSHETGTARMGSDSRISVLNRWNQCWDVPNLFVTDGACFVSSGFQNPTLTIMALTLRACDYILASLKRCEL